MERWLSPNFGRCGGDEGMDVVSLEGANAIYRWERWSFRKQGNKVLADISLFANYLLLNNNLVMKASFLQRNDTFSTKYL